MNRIASVTFFILLSASALFATDSELYYLAENHYKNREYYAAITEVMRLKHLYPKSSYIPKSFFLAGKAYYLGGNYSMAVNELDLCFSLYKKTSEAEDALNMVSYIRLREGSPLYALYSINLYRQTYPSGRYNEDTSLNNCYISAFTSDLNLALDEVKKFRVAFPEGKLADEAAHLESEIIREINRPKKSLFVSVGGSILIPGFGHFYTGHYAEGVLSFITTTALAFLSYDGYRARNNFRMIFFGVAGLSFYQYSIVSAVNNVDEYNSRDGFIKRLRISLSREF